MRISTNMLYSNMQANSANLTGQLQKLNSQLGSGKKLETSSENPVDYYKASVLKDSISKYEQDIKNLNTLKYRNANAENVLSSSIDTVSELRDWIVSAKSDHRWETSAALDQSVISGLKDKLLGLANSKNENGDYMFSGYQNTKPFLSNGANINYAGDQGVRTLDVSNLNMSLEPSGDKVYMYDKTSTLDSISATNWYGGANMGSGFIVVNSTSAINNALSVVFSLDRSASPNVLKMDIMDNSGTSVVNGTSRTAGTDQPVAFPLTVSSGQSIDISAYLGQAANTTTVSISGNPDDGDMFSINNSTKGNIFNVFDNILNEMSKPLTAIGNSTHNNMTSVPTSLPDNVGKQKWAPVLDSALTEIDRWLDSVNTTRSTMGNVQAYAEKQVEHLSLANTLMDEERSGLEDLDYGFALMKQSQLTTQIQALYKSFNTTERLSLFDYIA